MSYRLVLVEWVDSIRPAPEWQFLSEYEASGIVRIASVGWLVHQCGEVIALAPNRGSVEGEADQASGIIHIPRVSVVRIADLLEANPDQKIVGIVEVRADVGGRH